MLILITKVKRVLRKKHIHNEPQIWLILLYLKLSWIIHSIVRAIFSQLLPIDHAYPEILVDSQDFDRLD